MGQYIGDDRCNMGSCNDDPEGGMGVVPRRRARRIVPRAHIAGGRGRRRGTGRSLVRALSARVDDLRRRGTRRHQAAMRGANQALSTLSWAQLELLRRYTSVASTPMARRDTPVTDDALKEMLRGASTLINQSRRGLRRLSQEGYRHADTMARLLTGAVGNIMAVRRSNLAGFGCEDAAPAGWLCAERGRAAARAAHARLVEAEGQIRYAHSLVKPHTGVVRRDAYEEAPTETSSTLHEHQRPWM